MTAISDPEPRLVLALRNAAGVAALVGTRIRGMRLEPGDQLPAIVYRRVSSEYEDPSSGTYGAAAATIRLDCWANSYLSAKALAKAVRGALNGHTDETVLADPIVQMCHLKDELDNVEEMEAANEPIFCISQDYYVEFATP